MGCHNPITNYQTKILSINPTDVNNLVQLGLKPNKRYLIDFDKTHTQNQTITVTKITPLTKKEDTYCFNEPKRHMGIFNGILTGNCSEITEVSTASEYSVCTLASICLPKYVKFVEGKPIFDYNLLCKVARVITRNLNNVIDINYYPVDKTRVSNLKHRPMGIGIQGLADVFAIFRTPFDSELAKDLNKKIFETIYFGAMTESMELAQEEGPYSTFQGSPISQGKFQFDLWGLEKSQLSGMWDWDDLRVKIMTYGVRNSLVTACMPTASTSQIMNNNEAFEAYTENIYTRTTLAGDYYVINKHLMKELIALGQWNEDIVDLIKYYKGSIAKIPNIPDDIKEIYRTVWEIDQLSIIKMAAERGPFVDQTQSMNIFIAKANFAKLNECLFTGWKLGLKTGMYYLRSKAASDANQFGIDINTIREIEQKYGIVSEIESDNICHDIESDIKEKVKVCKYDATKKGEGCLMCGS